MTKKNEIVETKTNAVAEYNDDYLMQFAGAGTDNLTIDDIQIPYLSIIEKNSPQLDEDKKDKYIDGAKTGHVFNTATNELFKDGVLVIPVAYEKKYVEWKPREVGGGFVGAHASLDGMPTHKSADGREDLLENGNTIVPTAYHYVLVVSPLGVYEAVISMAKTRTKASRNWNTAMMQLQVKRPDGRVLNKVPSFATMYSLSTVKQEKNNNTWYTWIINRQIQHPLLDECGLLNLADAESKKIFDKALEMHKAFQEKTLQSRVSYGDDDATTVGDAEPGKSVI